MPVQGAISLLPAMLDGRSYELIGKAAVAIFGTNGQPFNLRELPEKAGADAPRGVSIHLAEPMGRTKIVAVKLFGLKAELFGNIGGGPDREDLKDVFDGPGNRNFTFGLRGRLQSFGQHDQKVAAAVRVDALRVDEARRLLQAP